MGLKAMPFKMGLYAVSLPLKVIGKATKLTIAMVLPIIMMRTLRWMANVGRSSSRATGPKTGTRSTRSASHASTSSRGMGSESMEPRVGTYKAHGEEY